MQTSTSSSAKPPSANQPFLLLGLDVGGTKISGLAADRYGRIYGKVLVPTQVDGDLAEENHIRDMMRPKVVESILDAVRELLKSSGARAEEIMAIGLGIPGQVQAGQVRLAVNLKLESYPLARTLQAAFGSPAILENDVRAAAVGLHRHFRESQPVENFVYLSIGTGVAAGLVLQGELYRGTNGMAGEIGHIIVDPDGPRCNCGARGCLEALVAGPAIARLANDAVLSGQDTLMSGYNPLNPQAVFESAQVGDLAARRIVREVSKTLSRAIYGLIMAYDVGLLALGGGVLRAGDQLLAPLKDELRGLRADSALATQMLSGDKIVLAPQDFDAGAWGAIALAERALHLETRQQ